MKSILSSLFLFLILVATPVKGEEGNSGYCQTAETTADLMACIGIHYNAENDIMTNLYNDIVTKSSDRQGFQDNLKNNQDQWLEYRNSICELEGSIYEGGSLERVQQLDCMARVTIDRNEHFKKIVSSFEPFEIPVFASPPRWTNVLIAEYPDIFWAIGQAQSLDIDCDGINEKMISGIGGDETDTNSKKYVAVADSNLTGRAKIYINEIPYTESCSVTNMPTFVKNTSVNEGCSYSVVMQDEGCEAMSLEYDAITENYKLNKKEIIE